jgi:hypothetical protein
MAGRLKLKTASFPTPSLTDRIAVCERDPTTAPFNYPAIGTAVENCGFFSANDIAGYAGFVFAKAVPDQRSHRENWYFLNTRANEDEYNFETSYLHDSPSHPLVTRTYVVMREDYEALDDDATDPVNSELVLWEQKQIRFEDPILDSLFVASQATFGPLPGPMLTSETTDSAGVVHTITTQLVRSGSESASPGTLRDEAITPKSVLIDEVVVDTREELFDERVKSLSRSPGFIPPDFFDSANEISESWVEASTSHEPPVPVGTVVEESAQRITKFKRRRRKQSLGTASSSVTNKKLTEWGNASISRTTAHSNDVNSISHLTLDATAEKLPGSTNYLQEKVDVPAGVVRTKYDVDPNTGIVTTIESWLENPASVKKGKNVDGWFYEAQPAPFSHVSTIQLRSRVDFSTLPAEEVIAKRVNYPLPDVLTALSIIPVWAYAFIGSDYAFDSSMVFDPKIIEGHRGPHEARLRRKYLSRPPLQSDIPAPIVFKPEAITVWATQAWWRAGATRGAQAVARASQMNISPTLHTVIPIDAGPGENKPDAAIYNFSSNISATSPTAIPTSWFCIDANPETWRLGVYVVEILEINPT